MAFFEGEVEYFTAIFDLDQHPEHPQVFRLPVVLRGEEPPVFT